MRLDFSIIVVSIALALIFDKAIKRGTIAVIQLIVTHSAIRISWIAWFANPGGK